MGHMNNLLFSHMLLVQYFLLLNKVSIIMAFKTNEDNNISYKLV